MHTLGASKCMHVVHSVGFAIDVGFGWFYFNGGSMANRVNHTTNDIQVCFDEVPLISTMHWWW